MRELPNSRRIRVRLTNAGGIGQIPKWDTSHRIAPRAELIGERSATSIRICDRFSGIGLAQIEVDPCASDGGEGNRMGALPKQHDPASRERNPEHDQLNAGVLSFIRHAYARSRTTLLDSTIADEKIRGSLRSAAVLIVIFQIGYAAQQLHSSAPKIRRDTEPGCDQHRNRGRFLSVNLRRIDAALLASNRALRMHRVADFGVRDRRDIDAGRAGVHFVCVIVIGAGTLAPWDWPWQAAVSCAGMICFFLVGRAHGVVDSDPPMHWLGFATAVGLAQSNVYLQMNNRRTHRANGGGPIHQ